MRGKWHGSVREMSNGASAIAEHLQARAVKGGHLRSLSYTEYAQAQNYQDDGKFLCLEVETMNAGLPQKLQLAPACKSAADSSRGLR